MAVPVGHSPASILGPGCSSGGTSLGEGATSGLPHVATCRESQDGSGSGLALLRHLHFRLSCPRFGSCELCKCLNNKIHPGLYYPWPSCPLAFVLSNAVWLRLIEIPNLMQYSPK